MAKYKIKHTSIMHNGKLYSEGSAIELTENQAKRLEDFLTLIPETKQSKTPATNKQGTKQKTETSVKEEKSEGGNDEK